MVRFRRPYHLAAEPTSKLRAQPRADHGDRTAIAVVGRVDDELVVDREPPGKQRQAVIGLDDLFRARMRQLAVAHDNAEAAGVEECLMHARNAVDNSGQSEY